MSDSLGKWDEQFHRHERAFRRAKRGSTKQSCKPPDPRGAPSIRLPLADPSRMRFPRRVRGDLPVVVEPLWDLLTKAEQKQGAE